MSFERSMNKGKPIRGLRLVEWEYPHHGRRKKKVESELEQNKEKEMKVREKREM